MTSRAWYYRPKGYFYAVGPYRFPRAITEQRFREILRADFGVNRLSGEVWPTNG